MCAMFVKEIMKRVYTIRTKQYQFTNLMFTPIHFLLHTMVKIRKKMKLNL